MTAKLNNVLEAIEVQRLSGAERFTQQGRGLGFDLQSFWQWSSSDLVGNALRGILAEYIVAAALGQDNGVRTEWDAYDVKTSNGVRIEVKSAAYLQSWKQSRLSNISFSIRQTDGWDSESNVLAEQASRQAQVYVFCILIHQCKSTINPLDLDQWKFYCIDTEKLNQQLGAQKTLSLGRLLKLNPLEVTYDSLAEAVQTMARNGAQQIAAADV